MSLWLGLCVYGFVPVVVAYAVIAHAFAGDGLLPIDRGDEPAETFVQVPMALSSLASGTILKINAFNNFGTPILGEPVVCPFAVHSLSYAFFQPSTAMLVNKFLLAALSIIVLTKFYSRYFHPLISSGCACLAFSSPAFFYFFQNHPHQGALFYFGLVLLAVRRVAEQPGALRGVCLYVTFVLFLFSVGVHGAILGTGFTWAFALFMARKRPWILLWIALSWCTACVAVHPHYVEFFRLAAGSARKELDYQQMAALPSWAVIKGLASFTPQTQQLWAAIYYAWPVLLLIGAGLVFMFFERWRRAATLADGSLESRPQRLARETRQLALFLGLIPCLVVLLCRIFPGLLSAIPFVRSTNITRLLWFSDIFLFLSVGLAAQVLWSGLKPQPDGADTTRAVNLSGPVPRRVHAGRITLLVLAGLCLITRYPVFRTLVDYHLCSEAWIQFEPYSFLKEMRPYTRLATLTPPMPLSQDTKANSHQILGSAGRSIILNGAFKEFLVANHLAETYYHDMSYFFLPAPPQILARFGIRYCMTSGPSQRMAKWGWIVRDEQQGDPTRPAWVLYENPSPVTPFYLAKPEGMEFLQDYRISGNEMQIRLPALKSPCELIATFLARPAWKAYLDGKPIQVQHAEDCLIHINLNSNGQAPIKSQDREQRLVFRYEPFTDLYLWFCPVVSLSAALALGLLMKDKVGDKV